jgi:TRAP-type C4-dicarboxylate transport system permease small subunit
VKILDTINDIVIYVDKLIERITSLFWLFGGLCIILMAFVVSYGAFTRYVFRDPASITHPITLVLMLACAIFAIPHTQKLGKHLRLDLLDNVFPRAVSEIIKNLLGPLLGLCFCIVLTWQGWMSAMFAVNISQMTTTDYPIPTFPLKLIITIVMGILCLVFILQILKYLFALRKRRAEIRTNEKHQKGDSQWIF